VYANFDNVFTNYDDFIPFLQQVMNCGFIEWVDEEWQQPLKNCLNKLWDMYYEEHTSRIDDRYENSKRVHELTVQKKGLEEMYSTV